MKNFYPFMPKALMKSARRAPLLLASAMALLSGGVVAQDRFAVQCASGGEAAFVDEALPVVVHGDDRAGAGAVGMAANEGRRQPALQVDADAGVRQVRVSCDALVAQRGP